jgi:hypothetical protein
MENTMRDLINLLENILTEASIFTKPKDYGYGHKVNVAAGSEKGQKLMSLIKSKVPDFDENEPLEWIAKAPARSPKIQFGTGDNQRYFKRPNGEYLILVGPDKSIQQGLIHAKGEKGSTAENKGDASEPVLSAAVVAKLIKRGKNNVEDITGNDIKEVLTQALLDPNLTYTVTDKNSRVADTIEFSIKVKKPTMDYLLSDDFWVGYEPFLPSVVHYANSGQMDRYADYFYKNGKVDLVRVVSDGVSEATTRKTDIEAYITDDSGERRKLKGLNVSLKAGSPHIGQVGGGQILNPNSKGYVLSNAQELFGPFGLDINAPKKINSKVEFWVDAYKQAAKQLSAQLKGSDAKTEAGVVYRIANFVTNHATKGDPDIRLVSLGTKGLSSIHSFKNIAQKIANENIDLVCEYRQGVSKTGDPRPEIRIYDKNSGKPLIYIRYSSTQDETKIWNTVEMKDLLKELTTLKYNKSAPRPAGAQAPVPVAQTPAPPVQTPAPAAQVTPGAVPVTPTTTRLQGTQFTSPQPGLPDDEEQTPSRLTGPGAKIAKKQYQPQMTAEVLGREKR